MEKCFYRTILFFATTIHQNGFIVLENFRNVLQRLVSRKDRGDLVQIDQKPEVLQAGIENPQYDSRSYITWIRTK